MMYPLARRLTRAFYMLFTLGFAWLTAHIVIGGFYDYHEITLLLCAACALAVIGSAGLSAWWFWLVML